MWDSFQRIEIQPSSAGQTSHCPSETALLYCVRLSFGLHPFHLSLTLLGLRLLNSWHRSEEPIGTAQPFPRKRELSFLQGCFQTASPEDIAHILLVQFELAGRDLVRIGLLQSLKNANHHKTVMGKYQGTPKGHFLRLALLSQT